MKTFISLIIGTGLIFLTFFSFSKAENSEHNGKCTGSAYCSACSNCSRCGHCGSGGICGVCSGSSSGNSYSNSEHSKKKIKSATSETKNNNSSLGFHSKSKRKTPVYHYEPNAFLDDDNLLYTIYNSVNIRSGAGKDLPIVATLKLNSKLIFLYEKGKWYKVRIFDSGKEGYVYFKSVK